MDRNKFDTVCQAIGLAENETTLYDAVTAAEAELGTDYAGTSWDEAQAWAAEDGEPWLEQMYRLACYRWETITAPGYAAS